MCLLCWPAIMAEMQGSLVSLLGQSGQLEVQHLYPHIKYKSVQCHSFHSIIQGEPLMSLRLSFALFEELLIQHGIKESCFLHISFKVKQA